MKLRDLALKEIERINREDCSVHDDDEEIDEELRSLLDD